MLHGLLSGQEVKRTDCWNSSMIISKLANLCTVETSEKNNECKTDLWKVVLI